MSTLPKRFWKRVAITDTCWLWNGHCDRQGYGRFTLENVSRLAHRVAYIRLVGPIAEGHELDHLCRVRHCVNPKHLEPVTHAENVRRGRAGHENNWQRRKTHCPVGHELAVENVFFDRQGWRHCRECMRAQVRRWRASH